jgi:hypothetical protein
MNTNWTVDVDRNISGCLNIFKENTKNPQNKVSKRGTLNRNFQLKSQDSINGECGIFQLSG